MQWKVIVKYLIEDRDKAISEREDGVLMRRVCVSLLGPWCIGGNCTCVSWVDDSQNS